MATSKINKYQNPISYYIIQPGTTTISSGATTMWLFCSSSALDGAIVLLSGTSVTYVAGTQLPQFSISYDGMNITIVNNRTWNVPLWLLRGF